MCVHEQTIECYTFYNMENFRPRIRTPEPEENPQIKPEMPDSGKIENAHFFENAKDDVEGVIRKRSLSKVGKERFSGESEDQYRERVENLAERKLANDLPGALKEYYDFKISERLKREDRRHYVDATKLLPMVKIQNEMVSLMSGLQSGTTEDQVEMGPREDVVIKAKERIKEWFKENDVSEQSEVAKEMLNTFDGCLAVCSYMDRRKKERGGLVEFYTNDYLDWRYGIDLIETDRGQDLVELNLIQSKSSIRPSDDVDVYREKHHLWVKNDLLGIEAAADEFATLVQIEMASLRHEDLRDHLAGAFAKGALKVMELIRKVEEGSVEDSVGMLDDYLEGESEISKIALVLSFYEEEVGAKNSKIQEILRQYSQRFIEKKGEGVVRGLGVTKVNSILTVNGIEPYPPATLYSQKREGRNLFIGSDQDI